MRARGAAAPCPLWLKRGVRLIDAAMDVETERNSQPVTTAGAARTAKHTAGAEYNGGGRVLWLRQAGGLAARVME